MEFKEIINAFLQANQKRYSHLSKSAIDALAILSNVKASLRGLSDHAALQELTHWHNTSIFLLKKVLANDVFKSLDKPNSTNKVSYKRVSLKILKDIELKIQTFPKSVLKENPKAKLSLIGNKTVLKEKNKIFIVHGHDNELKVEVAKLISDQGVEYTVLHEEPNQGRTIIEKFEENADNAKYAIILLTPDDAFHSIDGAINSYRARQNVILEMGYFFSKLGRKNVCMLYKDKTELPSDSLGIVYTKVDKAGAWKYNLAKELKEAGYAIDLNKVK